MTYTVQLSVVAGDGRLARRSRALLFLPEAPTDTSLVEEFLVVDDDVLEARLTEFVLAHNDDAPPFIFLAWPRDASGERIQLIVRGDATINSDIDSVPRLSGTGSSTWVEHRVLRNPDQAVFTSGPTAASGTDLTGGVVPASGFSLALQLPLADATDATTATPRPPTSASTPAPATPASLSRQDTPTTGGDLPDAPESPTAAAAAAADTADDPTVDPTPTHTETPAAATLDALVALEAAAGGDRAEESLQPTDTATPPTATPSSATPPGAARAEAPPVPDPPPAAITAPVPTTTPPRRPAGEPPVFPGSDDEVTLTATEAASPMAPESHGGDPVTQARMCPNGHPNDPNNASCRLCALGIDSDAALITVEQPTLARLRLPDGSAVEVGGTLVIGRKPSEDAARVKRATLVALAAPASVSRTHLSISVDGWRILVTDCDSRSGSALVINGDDEPVPLEPWMAHEVNDGDHLYLGGPTRLVVEEFTAT